MADHSVIEIFLQVGASVNLSSNESGTALIAAAMKSQEKSVMVLLEAGADVNAKIDKRTPALLEATVAGSEA